MEATIDTTYIANDGDSLKDNGDKSPKKTLHEHGYFFNEDGIMQTIGTNQKFSFALYESQRMNQKRYDEIGEALNDHIYEELVKVGLDRYNLTGTEGSTPGFVFVSKDIKENTKLLILIHGSGVVRAGQWARRLIMNDNISCGSQLPYIRKAFAQGYAILVLNTNLEGTTPLKHALQAWDEIVVTQSVATKIAIVAHSYGGVVVTSMFESRNQSFTSKVFSVAFTDSVHIRRGHDPNNFWYKKSTNWISHKDPLDTPIHHSSKECRVVSAGHKQHEYTSSSSINSVFEYFSKNIDL